MKITYITHACLLIEIGKVKILTDPWLTGPCWGGSLWHYPTHNFTPKNLPVPDYIFYSHGHDDHYHYETIKNFPTSWFNAKIIAPNFGEEWWNDSLESKFKKIVFLNHEQKYEINKDLKLQVFMNDKGDCDSSLKIMSKKKNIFLQTDNLMSFSEAKKICSYGKIDIAFVIPFLTGVFPGFYSWKSETLIKLGKEKINKSLDYCSEIVRHLKPKYVIPYACDLGYLGDQFHVNLIHTHNKNDLANMIKKKNLKSKPIVLNPGDNIKMNGTFKKQINYKNIDQMESLIKFANEKNSEYKKYLLKENRQKNPKLNKLAIIFLKKLKDNLHSLKKFNFQTLINILEGEKKKKILLDFKNKKFHLVNDSFKKPTNLVINIQSNKIRNLINKKYQMNFLTFHNGGYTCQRSKMNLTMAEKKYWDWINNLNFFI